MPRVVSPKSFGPPLGMYSHGMVAPGGEILVVAGQVGLDARGELAGDDVGAQTKQALANVRAIVEAAGCTMRDVVRLQTFLTSADDIPAFVKARGEVFADLFPTGVYPPHTLLVITRLFRPELRVEVEAMAVRSARGAAAKARGAAPKSARRGAPATQTARRARARR